MAIRGIKGMRKGSGRRTGAPTERGRRARPVVDATTAVAGILARAGLAGRVAVALALAGVASAGSPWLPGLVEGASAQDAVASLPLEGMEVVGRPIVRRKSYNYEPSVFKEGSTYHAYWCGGVAGDYVLHLESSSLAGPWRSRSNPTGSFIDTALRPSGAAVAFDNQQTCDPSVIKVYGYYYLYYTGLGTGGVSAIGVAASRDPVHFGRLNGGRPIATAAMSNPAWRDGHGYGAGQPSATYVAPYVYLTFTDTTAKASSPGDGSGQYVLRSTDPGFGSGVQELTAAGWTDRAFGQRSGERSIAASFANDWAYDERSGEILVLSSGPAESLTLRAVDPNSFATVASGTMPMQWREGPGLLKAADGKTPERADCARAPIAAFAAAGASNDPYSWNEVDLSIGVFDLSAICPGGEQAAR